VPNLISIFFHLKACRILVGKLERKRPLGRPRRRWVNNIQMDVRIGWCDWIDLVQDRDQWTALVKNESSGSIKCWEVLE
jgi:hypothetical protein